MQYETLLNARDYGASGSEFTTGVTVTAGSRIVKTADTGDFAEGQGVCITGGDPRCDSFRLFGPKPCHAKNRPVQGEVEIRGWDASNGPHAVYLLDVDPARPDAFRWTDDLGRNWHECAMTLEWQTLSAGLEVCFHPFEWEQGWVVTVVMRSSIEAKIVRVEEDSLEIDREASADAEATAMHSDTAAIQTAIDAALAADKGVFLPCGHYRLSDTLRILDPRSFTLRGENPERTVLDIGVGGIGIEAQGGSCLVTQGGTETKVIDLSFRGGMGFAERDQAGHMRTRGATGVWGFYFMKSNAMGVWNTARVYVENCHARHMSAECFYSSSVCRSSKEEPAEYTRSITYLRCSVEDCARNAFNNNDKAENTHIIDCRIRDVGGCTWEGASRFVRMSGCYVRNSGSVAMGNVRSRAEENELLGTGQHVIEGNTFESGCPYGLAMVTTGACATQVVIRDNIFVNFNSNAVLLSGDTGPRDLPARNAIVSGNSFDMTAAETPSKERCAIRITSSDVTVSDNQIFVNSSEPDPLLTGIQRREDTVGVIIHDNMLRNCGAGIEKIPCHGVVGEVLDDRHFLRSQDGAWSGMPPVPRRRSHRCAGWLMRLEDGSILELEGVDPETGVFTLKNTSRLTKGQTFRLIPSMRMSRTVLVHDNLVY